MNKVSQAGDGRSRRRSGAGMRLRGLIRKEFLQIVRDPSSIGIAFLMPVILLLLFGYGVSLDVEQVPIALVVDQPDADTADLAGAFRGSRYFNPHYYATQEQAEEALLEGEVWGVVRILDDFGEKIRTGGLAPIQVIVNGVDSNTARLVNGYAEGVVGTWLEHRSRTGAETFRVPVQLEHRIWFNAEVRSRNYLVPGLIAIIMTLIGALLTAMVVAREWERGTMEALMVTPVSMTEILLGKLIPYFLLGMGGLLLSVAMAFWLFEVPLRGSFWVLLVLSALFLLVALGMGLLISILAKNQFVAGQAAIITTFLPAFLLSGFIFDIGSMPWVVRVITHAIAARYFVAILQSVFLAGNVWSVLWINGFALIVLAVFFLGLSRVKARKRLD